MGSTEVDIPAISLAELLARYDALLLDAYGVLVGDEAALPGAVALIDWLNDHGKPYLVVTNSASRLPETAARRYGDFGLDIPAQRILTSGSLLQQHFRTHRLIDARCVVLGPEDSRTYVVRAGGHVVTGDGEFDVLVICDEKGFPFLETVDGVLTALFAAIDGGRTPHLVLPNPDLIYPTGKGYGVTAGSIALIIEAALALRYPGRRDLRFHRLGKPEPALFAAAVERLGTRRLVMIGDQLETDVRGARAFGLDAAWLEGGVSAGPLADARFAPTWVLPSLAGPLP
ncbi:HAD-IIA family hydrolase [Thiobacter aerophilum]|uniref:HAD-IA family hydrolase n=1 Tax=Thiobacter aerophilum TaxID=3121275 RepID=A0ABV0EBD3_9BURK